MDRSSSFADRGGMQGSRAGASDRAGQMGQTARTQDRQAGMSDRTASRTDARGDRQQAATDRSQGRQDTRGDRQDGRTDRTEARQDARTDRTEVRQENRTDRAQGRQEAARDISDDWHGGYYGGAYYDHWDDWHPWGYVAAGAAVVAGAYAVGTMINAATYSTLACTPTTVVVGGVTYSQCGSTWYQPTYSGGDVTYIVVNPPAGH
jgi:hypothetical protein